MKTPLTKAQHGVFAFVRRFIAEKGYAPSLEEIGAGLGYRSCGTVHDHLSALERRGWIRREHNKERSIAIVDDGEDALHATALKVIVAWVAWRKVGASSEKWKVLVDAIDALEAVVVQP